MTTKRSYWQRLRDPTMTPEERAAFFHHLSALGKRARVTPLMLRVLLEQVREDMDRRKEARSR